MIKELAAEPEKLIAEPKVKLIKVENLGNVNHKIMVPNLRELKEEVRGNMGSVAVLRKLNIRLLSDLNVIDIFSFLDNVHRNWVSLHLKTKSMMILEDDTES